MSLSAFFIALCAVFSFGAFLWGREAGKKDACLGFRATEAKLKGEISTLCQQKAQIAAEVVGLRAAEKMARDQAEQRRLKYAANDISSHENQMRFIEECHLRLERPVNREASNVLYVLQNWIDSKDNGWRMAFEVSMGAFIKTSSKENKWLSDRAFGSYSGKRVDFLLIDAQGVPKLAVEYHGTGHDLSEDADDRMKVKRRVLERVGLPLVEIPARTTRAEMKRMIASVFDAELDEASRLAS